MHVLAPVVNIHRHHLKHRGQDLVDNGKGVGRHIDYLRLKGIEIPDHEQFNFNFILYPIPLHFLRLFETEVKHFNSSAKVGRIEHLVTFTLLNRTEKFIDSFLYVRLKSLL